MSDDERFAPRLNHVAISMEPELLDDAGRAEILAFYGDVFGWTEGDNSGEIGNPLIMTTGEVMQFVYLLPGDPALACPTLDHFGLQVSSVDEIEAIVAKAKAWQEKDDRVTIIDVKARESEGLCGGYVLTSVYIGYLLPMMVELQHLARRRDRLTGAVDPADRRRRLRARRRRRPRPRGPGHPLRPLVVRRARPPRRPRRPRAALPRRRRGDRVAGALPNDLDVILAFHGAMRIGAIWVGSTAPSRRPRSGTCSTTAARRSAVRRRDRGAGGGR